MQCLVGCSLVVEPDAVQCSITADCRARGSAFSDTRCEGNICVAVSEEDDSTPMNTDVSSASGTDEAETTEPESDTDGTRDAGASPPAVESPSSCERTSDCSAEDICLDEVCVDPFDCPVMAPEGAFSITASVQDVFGTPLAGADAQLCRNIDPECLSPVEELMTDEAGELSVAVPDGFTGYLEFTVDGYFPQLQVLPTDLSDGDQIAVSLSPTLFIDQLGLAVGAQPDPERGHLFLNLVHCYGPAEGVQITSMGADDDAIVFYVLNGVPSSQLTETTVEGSGGFLNFPAGNTAITLTHAGSLRELSKQTFVVRPSFMTVATVRTAVE